MKANLNGGGLPLDQERAYFSSQPHTTTATILNKRASN